MTTVATHSESRPKPKSFTYRTNIDNVRGRFALLHSDQKPPLVVGAPAEFKGTAGIWSPEDFFVASVEACLMLTFVGVAENLGLRYDSYSSSAEGLLEWHDISYQFTRVTVHPTIVLSDESEMHKAREVLARAHRRCLIANSIHGEVEVLPTFALLTTAV